MSRMLPIAILMVLMMMPGLAFAEFQSKTHHSWDVLQPGTSTNESLDKGKARQDLDNARAEAERNSEDAANNQGWSEGERGN